jgi:hypothetical protein
MNKIIRITTLPQDPERGWEWEFDPIHKAAGVAWIRCRVTKGKKQVSYKTGIVFGFNGFDPIYTIAAIAIQVLNDLKSSSTEAQLRT